MAIFGYNVVILINGITFIAIMLISYPYPTRVKGLLFYVTSICIIDVATHIISIVIVFSATIADYHY